MVEMENKSWVSGLAFLVDITTCTNELNTKLQRKVHQASKMHIYIIGFMNKLRLWQAHIQNEYLPHFPTLKEMGMLSKKTKFADQLEKLIKMNFRLASKTSNSMNIYLKYFLYLFTLTLKKPSWISTRN